MVEDQGNDDVDDEQDDVDDEGQDDDAKKAGSGKDDAEGLRKQLAELTADRDKWKTRSRQHEDRAKKNSDDAKAKQTLEQRVEQMQQDMADRDAADLVDKASLAGEKLHAKLVRGGLSDEDATVLVNTIDPVRLLTDGKPDTGEIDKLAKSLTKIGTRAQVDTDQGKKSGGAAPTMNQMIREAANRTRVG